MHIPGPSSESENPLPDHHINIDIPKSKGSRVYIVREKMQGDKPLAVSLGPYHHYRDNQLGLAEPFKEELRDMLCGDRIAFLRRKITKRIHKFYSEPCGYTGKKLAEMMLRDASFLICFMHGFGKGEEAEPYIQMCERMGMSAMLSVSSDICMLENQIPLWLISLIYPQQYKSLLCEYLSYRVYGDYRMTQLPWKEEEREEEEGEEEEDDDEEEEEEEEGEEGDGEGEGGGGEGEGEGEEEGEREEGEGGGGEGGGGGGEGEGEGGGEGEGEPRHLLDALRRTFLRAVETQQNSSRIQRESSKKITRSAWIPIDSLFRSVTDLKAKGIYLQRSSNCLTDISFFSFGLFAQLCLPTFWVNEESKVLFSNLILFEMSPGVKTDFGVTSYVNFMKTLINNANDVKVMREKGILCSTLENDEEVLDIFKSIRTYGFSSTGLGRFNEVKRRIDEYCNNKARIWMAELINTYFRSPWAVIAFLAAAFLLCLTVVQTYYAIHPSN